VDASRLLMGFAGVVVEKCGIQGVCSHVRRLKKAREVGRQKERDVWTSSAWAAQARVAILGMLRSCVVRVGVGVGVGLREVGLEARLETAL
jgi:hypothetical protein